MPRRHPRSSIDHDALHKQLLTHFFQQFLEGFFPEIAEQLDFSDFGPANILTQELFPELPAKLHRLDVVARVRPKGEDRDAFLIVFVEVQGKRRPEFLARVFRYFALLHIKFGTVVIPVVLYADDSRKPLDSRWTRYAIEFAGQRFLDFRFLAVHPSSLPVREFLSSHNPAQLTLAARMNLGQEDVTRLKLDLLRQLARLALTEVQIEHALRYLEVYLESKDSAAFQRELDLLATTEYQEASMLIEHFTKLGIEKGKAEGKAEGLEEGLRLKALEDARKMLARGYDWSDITEITGIRPEDLG